MSREKDGEFFRIAAEIFTPGEMKQMPEIVSGSDSGGFTLEPLSCNYNQLFGLFCEFSQRFNKRGPNQGYDKPEFALELNEVILPSMGVEPGDEMVIDNSLVYIDSGGAGIVFPNDIVVGNFVGIYPHELFNVPRDYKYAENLQLCGTGVSIPYAALRDARIETMDGEKEYLGDTIISLWNGEPDLYKLRYVP